MPTATFPNFGIGDFLGSEQAGWLQHDGIWTIFEIWGHKLPGGFQRNAANGPVYFYNTSFSPAGGALSGLPSKPPAVILSPSDHFHGTVVSIDQAKNRLLWGPRGSIPVLEEGYNSSVLLVGDRGGVTAAASRWGKILRNAYGLQRISKDHPRAVSRKKVSYFSDNGAVYFQSFWDRACPTRNCTQHLSPGGQLPEDLFRSLPAIHNRSVGFVPGIYQLDTWWFLQSADVGGSGGLQGADWVPRPDMFPSGIRTLADDIPLLLYSWNWATPAHGNRMLNYTWQPSYPVGGATYSMTVLDEVHSFYSMIRDRFLSYGGLSYETDNMGTNLGSFPYGFNSTSGPDRWWAGFASPWCESGIPVQICESTGADIMASLRYPCVAVSRDTIDDVPGQFNATTDNNFIKRWHVGFARMLLGAMDVRPFFDNTWTNETQPQSTWGQLPEKYLDLAWILSVLSTGPVAFSDEIGAENATLIHTACNQFGELLQPTAPSIYMDFVYLPKQAGVLPFDPTVGRVFQAPSVLPGGPSSQAHRQAAPLVFQTMLSVDVNETFLVHPEDFAQGMEDAAGLWLAVPYAPGLRAMDARCRNSSELAACALPFGAASPLDAYVGIGDQVSTHAYEMWSISPVRQGWSLLGELAKVTRVSPDRFAWVCFDCEQGKPLSFAIHGSVEGPQPSVDVAVAAPGSNGGLVWRLQVDVPAAPAVSTCSCDPNGCACSHSQ